MSHYLRNNPGTTMFGPVHPSDILFFLGPKKASEMAFRVWVDNVISAEQVDGGTRNTFKAKMY